MSLDDATAGGMHACAEFEQMKISTQHASNLVNARLCEIVGPLGPRTIISKIDTPPDRIEVHRFRCQIMTFSFQLESFHSSVPVFVEKRKFIYTARIHVELPEIFLGKGQSQDLV
jgi:hypothetical protein